jgi:hypothetical protein
VYAPGGGGREDFMRAYNSFPHPPATTLAQ